MERVERLYRIRRLLTERRSIRRDDLWRLLVSFGTDGRHAHEIACVCVNDGASRTRFRQRCVQIRLDLAPAIVSSHAT